MRLPVLFVVLLLIVVFGTTFGSIVYYFGFGFTLLAYVVYSFRTGGWYTVHGRLPIRHPKAVVGELFVLALAIALIAIGVHVAFNG